MTIHTLGTLKLNKEPKTQTTTPDTPPLTIEKCQEQDETTLQEVYVVDNVSTTTYTAEMADRDLRVGVSLKLHVTKQETNHRPEPCRSCASC